MNMDVTFESMKEIYEPLPEDYDTGNRLAAFDKALDTSKLWTGIFYQEQRPTLQDRMDNLVERAGTYESLSELLNKFA